MSPGEGGLIRAEPEADDDADEASSRREPRPKTERRVGLCEPVPAFPLVSVAEDRGFEPLRAINPTRFPSRRVGVRGGPFRLPQACRGPAANITNVREPGRLRLELRLTQGTRRSACQALADLLSALGLTPTERYPCIAIGAGIFGTVTVAVSVAVREPRPGQPPAQGLGGTTNSRSSVPSGTPGVSRSPTVDSDAPAAWRSRSRTPPPRPPAGSKSRASRLRCATLHANGPAGGPSVFPREQLSSCTRQWAGGRSRQGALGAAACCGHRP